MSSIFRGAFAAFASFLLLLASSCASDSPSSVEGGARHLSLRQGEQFVRGADGTKLFVLLRGDGPVLLLPTPGWGPSHEVYSRTVTGLEERFTVAYVDTRGTGQSTHPRIASLYTTDRFVSDLERVRIALGVEKVFVFGHGSGGLLAATYALHHSAHCSGLILCGASANRGKEWLADMKARLTERSKKEGWFREALMKAQRVAETGPPLDDREAKARLLFVMPTMFADPKNFQKTKADFEKMTVSASTQRVFRAQTQSTDLLPHLESIAVPTLVIAGEEDHMGSPTQAKRIAVAIPGAKIAILPGAGHFPWIEQEKIFYSVIDAWRKKPR